MSQASAEFNPTCIAILTVSSRRGEEDDTSGHWLRDAAQEAGCHGETLTDIRAGIVVAVETKCLPNCALRCAGNWRYTRQAY